MLQLLERTIEVQTLVSHLHPCLSERYPVAVLEGIELHLFDPTLDGFRFEKTVPTPDWLGSQIAAAFPLEENANRMTCLVDTATLSASDGPVVVLHEFVHCHQFHTCEPTIKSTLEVAQRATGCGDDLWELEHPFPYTSPQFENFYGTFLGEAESNDAVHVLETRHKLKEVLEPMDFEYMVWQEWKEGFARHLENRARAHLGWHTKPRRVSPPFDRTSFYAGGDAYTQFLERSDPEITLDLVALYTAMLHPGA